MKKRNLSRILAVALVCAAVAGVSACSDMPLDDNHGDDGVMTDAETVRIIRTELINGNLIVTYSDGTVENLGPLSGESDSDSLSFYPLPDGTYGITAGNTIYLEGIAVPETYKGRTVTHILSNAFEGLTNLKSVSLPKTIVSIGESAFAGCVNLESVNIPDSVTDIGASAFYGCGKISDITIGDSIETIGSQAFYMCSGVKSVSLPDKVFSVGGSAFYGTSFYENEESWSDGVLYVGKHLVAVKSTIGGNCNVKEGTLTVADLAFGQCKSLTGVVLPDSVETLGSYAFMGCDMLQGVHMGEGSRVVSIGVGAFSKCIALKSVTLPASLVRIESETFAGCDKLETVNLNFETAVADSIGKRAFFGCASLTKIAIPDAVTAIGESAFEGCEALAVIELDIEKSTLVTVASKAFYGAKSVETVSIPKSVITIGDEAFADCEKLSEIVYGSTEHDWKWKVTKGTGWDKNVPCEKLTFTEAVVEETK